MIRPSHPTIALVSEPASTHPEPNARGLRVALVVSRYNERVTDSLRRGAEHEFQRLGGRPEDLVHVAAPGAFELPVLCRHAAESCDAVVALGCVIRGDTRHDEVIADAVAVALQRLSVDTGTPIAFGLLTVSTLEQALARAQPLVGATTEPAADDAQGKPVVDNKGVEAMRAAVEAVASIRALTVGADRA